MMLINEVLKEKYEAQKKLLEKAENESLDYFSVVEKDVKDLFSKNNWKLTFAKRKGGFIRHSAPHT
ncbi:MAG: hypothetical protein D6675_13215 [Gemmatimonadetes bacterium]|nr:MAG: hypothetical protein D6675_13215 [Gemmatimonadota bacterium]